VVVGLALWLWLYWKPHARLRWVGAGVPLVASWAGLVLLWDMLAGQFVALREAITGSARVGARLSRALSVWGKGTLLGPTIAGLVQFFRPQQPHQPTPAQQPAQPALPAQPAQATLSGVHRRLTLPRPAVPSFPPPDTSSLAS
jgi:hypothetical protein